MRKAMILMFVIASVALTASVVGACEKSKGMETANLIAVAEEPETEIEVVADGKRHTEILAEGVNFLTYKIKDPQTFRTVEYGVTIKPWMYEGDEAWYAYTVIEMPGESLGE